MEASDHFDAVPRSAGAWPSAISASMQLKDDGSGCSCRSDRLLLIDKASTTAGQLGSEGVMRDGATRLTTEHWRRREHPSPTTRALLIIIGRAEAY